MSWITLLSTLLLFTLTACGGATVPEAAQVPPEATATNTALPPTEPPPSSTPTEVAPPTATATLVVVATEAAVEPAIEPTEAPAPATPTPDAKGVDWLASVGRTEDNLMYLGNPDAPVTLTDYSDFL